MRLEQSISNQRQFYEYAIIYVTLRLTSYFTPLDSLLPEMEIFKTSQKIPNILRQTNTEFVALLASNMFFETNVVCIIYK